MKNTTEESSLLNFPIKKPLDPAYLGPFLVETRPSQAVYIVRIPNKVGVVESKAVSTLRLKPAFSSTFDNDETLDPDDENPDNINNLDLRPILWNVMYDAVLRLNFRGNVRIVGFVDDIAKRLWQIEYDLKRCHRKTAKVAGAVGNN
ncbi:hypothetical protein TKK_0015264 [Trichogramma kaykai]